jgi:phosphatidylserine/phosphatidylglycerophosphate/cardiolipin synthase-like enzyme
MTVGQTTPSQVLTLTNSGTATLTLSSVVLSDTSDYSMMSTCGASLATSANCTLTLAFKPQSAASLPATITVNDNATGSPQAVALTGTGTIAAVPQATLAPATGLTFASTTAGSTSAAQTLTLTNTGNTTLSIAGIAISGANPSAFAQTTTCAGSLPAAGSCAISVTFTPAAASTSYSASVTVTDNSGSVAGSTQSATLSGSGAAPVATPQAVLSTPSLTFASTNVGSSAGAQPVMLSNPGNAALTGIVISIGGGTASSAFTDTTTCAATLAAGSNCSISVNFTPSTTGNFAATLSVADNATGSPQTVALAGIGAAPQTTLSSTSINIPTTTVGTTSSAYSTTLTNSGNATLNISSILLGGVNASDFTESTTCGATLAAAASCTISATFTPAAASTYAASITVADNATSSPQTINLSGSGTTAAVTYTFYAFPETDLSVTPLYLLINNAQKTIDMTMYALEDTVFSGDLVKACQRGVKVRVILDQNNEKSGNTPAYNQLNAVTNCSAVWANKAFESTHEKSFILDGTLVSIMSLNLQTQYYSTTRDYAMVENDPVDIAAIQATFNADYAAGTPSSGVAGASDFSYTPGAGTDLIWSPTTAQTAMLAIINNAKSTLLVENEEMGASNIVSALEAACQRGVVVHIAMVDDSTKAPFSSYSTQFTALEAAGCGVHTYPDTTTGLYIHAKAVVADYSLGTQKVYMGSINYSSASMNNNRELGMYITDPTSVLALYTTMTSDYAGAAAF